MAGMNKMGRIRKDNKASEDSKKPLFGFFKDAIIIRGDIVSLIDEKWDAEE